MQKKNQTGEQAVGEMMKRERDEKAERFRYLNRYVKKRTDFIHWFQPYGTVSNLRIPSGF